MLKKLLCFSLALLLTVGLAGCAPSGGGRVSPIKEDASPIPLPESLNFASNDDISSDTVSSAYFVAADTTLENIQNYYQTAFKDLGVEQTLEMNQEDFVNKEIVPPVSDEKTLVWSYYGRYPLDSETESSDQQPSNVNVCVTVAQNGPVFAIEVAVGAQAKRMAEANKMIDVDKKGNITAPKDFAEIEAQ